MENRTADGLIRRIGAGDMSALEELYGALSQRVYAYALTIVRSSALAEDIMQDTFVRVFNAAPRFRTGGSGVSWIMRIAHNLAINAVSARQTVPPEEAGELPSSSSTEQSAVERTALDEALGALGESERRIVMLHAAGLTLGEIAEVVAEPLGTVKWRHASALKKLKVMLEESEVTGQ